MKKQTGLTALIIGLLAVSMGTAVCVYAQTLTTASVYIGYPSNPQDLGITSGNYWIGQFPITITTSNGITESTEVYCINQQGTVYEGTTYNNVIITPAQDTPAWESVAYIMTWDSPVAGDNDGAASAQVAIWQTIGTYDSSEFSLPSNVIAEANSFYSDAAGKQVAQDGDDLRWITPTVGGTTSTQAYPGQTVEFQAQLQSPQSGVQNAQIDFSATIGGIPLDSSYISQPIAFTDSDGIATVYITVPQNTPVGSTIDITASTKGVWPSQFLDLISNNQGTQNLICVTQNDAFSLTTSTQLQIQGTVFVLPESAWGALSGLIAFAAAFVICTRTKRPKNQ